MSQSGLLCTRVRTRFWYYHHHGQQKQRLRSKAHQSSGHDGALFHSSSRQQHNVPRRQSNIFATSCSSMGTTIAACRSTYCVPDIISKRMISTTKQPPLEPQRRIQWTPRYYFSSSSRTIPKKEEKMVYDLKETEATAVSLPSSSKASQTKKKPRKNSKKVKQETSTTKSSTNDVDDMYTRKTPVEHILLRPSMYVGPTERIKQPKSYSLGKKTLEMFRKAAVEQRTVRGTDNVSILTKTPTNQTRLCPDLTMHSTTMETIPAMSKIFDEILVNASDNRLRNSGRSSSQKSTTRIDVIIDPGSDGGGVDKSVSSPFIQVWNNGRGIPIQMHTKEQMYIPELVFGHLLTGSNFDDTSKRLTGGRHGYGAKLTNIFSNEFIVETIDTKRKLYYQQSWTNNMSQCSDPHIIPLKDLPESAANAVEDCTCVSFVPDLQLLSTGGEENVANKSRSTSTVLHPDDFAFMCRRVVDIAGCTHGQLEITLNGIPLSKTNQQQQVDDDICLNGFENYCQLYLNSTNANKKHKTKKNVNNQPVTNSSNSMPLLYSKVNSRWEVGIALSTSGSFECISFVNGMYTSRGGSHVNLIVNQLIKKLTTKLSKQFTSSELKTIPFSNLIKRHLFIFVNALIENPTFDSQMKDTLTSHPSTFGSECQLSQTFLNNVIESGGIGLVEHIERSIRGAQHASLLKEVGVSDKLNERQARKQLLGIDKLEDAHWAGNYSTSTANGKSKAQQCTLILTEGDSAKALAVAGLEIVGRDTYGVFPLRGKLLNVKAASLSKIATNQEIKHLCQILGLDFQKSYSTQKERETLRYGHVMLMTDQDTDGSHIKGLIINLFHHFWPSLLMPPQDENSDETGKNNKVTTNDASTTSSFLSFFRTPLLKARKKKSSSNPKTTKKKNKRQQKNDNVISFFSIQDYDKWNQTLTEQERRQYTIKYYKGLGTSTTEEAKEYFRDFSKHHCYFTWDSDDNGGERIDMVFDKERAADRREWILERLDALSKTSSTTNNDDDDECNNDEGKDGNAITTTYTNFVDDEMIHFANSDNIRSIPQLMDGLKPSQRKVLFSCFKRGNLSTNEMKVAQLAGYCAEQTSYHHGEQSLHSTIVGMAQNFVGSNNVPLLEPLGQFGTRFHGGKDAASPRYIFTKLSPYARLLFPQVDDILLTNQQEDGQVIEPYYYCPIVPLIVVNGAQGIGTGWSTFIPPGNLSSVIEYVRSKLDQENNTHHKQKRRSSKQTTATTSIEPYVEGFTGTITPKVQEEKDGNHHTGYVTRGVITRTSSTKVTITELPVGRWINDYKLRLIQKQKDGKILDFIEQHTSDQVCFIISMRSAKLDRLFKHQSSSSPSSKRKNSNDNNNNIYSDALLKEFDLETTLNVTNMHLFDPPCTTNESFSSSLSKYHTLEEIANVHFHVRRDLYVKRKLLLEGLAEFDATLYENKSKFIHQVAQGEIDLLRQRTKKSDAEHMLQDMGYHPMTQMIQTRDQHKKNTQTMSSSSSLMSEEDTSYVDNDVKDSLSVAANSSGEYDYLLNMPLSSFTSERIDKLESDVMKRKQELQQLQNTTSDDLWRTDLDVLEEYHHKGRTT